MTKSTAKYILQIMILIFMVVALTIPHFMICLFGTYYNFPANWYAVFVLGILFLNVTFKNDKGE